MFGRPVWAEIDLGAIAHNVRALKSVAAPGVKLMAVVKANAYGHGVEKIAKIALNNGAEQLGVAILNEGIQLRKAGFGVPVLIFGYTPPEQAAEVIKNNLTQTVYRLEDAQALSWAAVQLRKTVRVHIKIDTGMGRLGFVPGPDAVTQIKEIVKLPNLTVEGLYTHFADADSLDKHFTRKQFMLFQSIIYQLEKQGISIPLKHCANSAALIDLPETHLDMVRAGISLYGYYPSEEVDKKRVDLRPGFFLKARIAHLKEVPEGTTISYGRTFVTDRTTTIATIPLGYADGFTRLLSSKAEMLIKGCRVPVVGRVCMDQCMVDVGGIPDLEIGEEVVIIGKQGSEQIFVEEVAAKIGTINYEVICMISSRVPRVYIG